MDTGLLIIRIVIGLLVAAHGAQKVFGWFGGHGIDGTAAFFESLGYKPGRPYAGAAGLSELGAGILLLFGFLTPLAAAMLIGVMVNAIVAVHMENGLWVTDNGIEYPLVLSALAAGLAFTGPGSASVDAAFMWGSPSNWLGLAAVVLGVLAGLATIGMRAVSPALEEALSGSEDGRAERRAA